MHDHDDCVARPPTSQRKVWYAVQKCHPFRALFFHAFYLLASPALPQALCLVRPRSIAVSIESVDTLRACPFAAVQQLFLPSAAEAVNRLPRPLLRPRSLPLRKAPHCGVLQV